MCMFCGSLFVLLYFLFWPVCCLFVFDIQLLITPLVYLSFSYILILKAHSIGCWNCLYFVEATTFKVLYFAKLWYLTLRWWPSMSTLWSRLFFFSNTDMDSILDHCCFFAKILVTNRNNSDHSQTKHAITNILYSIYDTGQIFIFA
jgi:hypothetical protein